MIATILYIVFGLITAYVLFTGVYLLFFGIAGHFYRTEAQQAGGFFAWHPKIAVFVPAYKEDAVIIESAQTLLQQNYPAHMYQVFILADGLKPSTIAALQRLGVTVVNIQLQKPTKAGALQQGLQHAGDHFHMAVVFDADNHPEPDFLAHVAQSYKAGHKAIQGNRTFKNNNTALATLDAISEAANNHFFRKGHTAVGLSSALIGSGMAFDYALYKTAMFQNNTVSGFDKVLEAFLIERNIVTYYNHNAVVKDEKVSGGKVFKKQRTRWLAAHFRHSKSALGHLWHSLINLQPDATLKAIQHLVLPRLLLLALLLLGTVVAALATPTWLTLWLVAAGLQAMAMVLASPLKMLLSNGGAPLWQLPAVLVYFVAALFKMQSAKNSFLHTPHGHSHTK